MTRFHASLTAALLLVCSSPLLAQGPAPVGLRAAGMGGAFTAVADDGSAVYWNPAGLATGDYFSLLVDSNTLEALPGDRQLAASRSALLIALGTPPLGISYYRTRLTSVRATAAGTDDVRNDQSGVVHVDSLELHNTGVTLLQSLVPGLTVGTTLRLARGVATIATIPGEPSSDTLDVADSLVGRASTKFDLDIGVMAGSGAFKVGVTGHNLLRPEFDAPAGGVIEAQRQARAGVSFAPAEGWVIDADADLLTTDAPQGRWREVALGTEGRLGTRVMVRGGFRWNTAGDVALPSASVGGSVRALGVLWVDGQVTGSEDGYRGWGVGARISY